MMLILASDAKPCSMNSSRAWVDVVLLIDNSINMGPANLQKISTMASLIFSKFTIGNNASISRDHRNTRVAVISYNLQAKLEANFDNITSLQDLVNVLNGIKVSSNKEANIYDAWWKTRSLEVCNEAEITVENCIQAYRPYVYVFFAAANNLDINAQIQVPISFGQTTAITVNFNTADQKLTTLLNSMSINAAVNQTMYNFSSTSNMLTKDLEWAILQGNCFCDTVALGTPVILFDSANNRYTKYAECLSLDKLTVYLKDPLLMCQFALPWYIMPGQIWTQAKENFIEKFFTYNFGTKSYPFYIGYHRNSPQSNWAWYDGTYYTNITEVQGSGFSNWAPGYPINKDDHNCVIVDSNDGGKTFQWKNVLCSAQYSFYKNALCQKPAYDADRIYYELENPTTVERTKFYKSY
uniref:Uncharacterized protein n=1 Tax=Acrobeloides nanus TaxID=290746 RepID=A0A914D234_9BILA